ncbi:hypothetical protein GIB67_030059 [Kingdonia uniflora]|uniref:B-like cyclin n=1 Tax=Kingdonia uniflora TaxID=39325 RepID=A0A7J7MXZ5_9MAGN|nr:hypothetical protein GIB67_030059 [Kingdonia uniflora]
MQRRKKLLKFPKKPVKLSDSILKEILIEMGGRSNENNLGPAKFQGGVRMGGEKIVAGISHNRRALSNIDTNLMGSQPFPRAINKRIAPEKHMILCDKNPSSPARRITRRLALQLANKKQPCTVKETKHPIPSSATPSESDDCIIVDVEGYQATVNSHVPMYVKHTEAMMDEIDQMEEDIMEESVMDIDSCDLKNQLAVVEYVEEIHSYYRKAESRSCVSPSYMEQQFDINERMRGILIDWLIEVHYKFELMDETLFLMVNVIDRFLARETVLRKKLQLVGVTAMYLASKYEEVSVPIIDDLLMISDRAYTRKEVLDMESLICNTLQFDMSVPTPYVFMRRFLKAAQSDKKLELLSFFMIELCMVEYETLKFPPSLLAAAAVYTAQCIVNRFKHWSKTSEWHAKYSENDLMECARLMVTYHQKAASGKLTGVHKKYSTFKYGLAAKSEPANFLLDINC